jgi:hypothetical protein
MQKRRLEYGITVLALLLVGIGCRKHERDDGHFKNSRTQQLVQWIAAASDGYYTTYGHWPSSISELTKTPSGTIFANPTEIDGNDGYGHPLIYKPFDAAAGFGSVTSYGRDGRPGGTNVDRDVEVRFGK